MVFKTNVKMKNEDFWICSIIPTAVIFKSFILFFLFVTLFCHDIQQDWIQFMTLPMLSTVFAAFELINKK